MLDTHNFEGEIRCAWCNRLLAVDSHGKLEIKARDRSMRVYGWGVVCIDCSRCGRTAEIMLPTRLVPTPQNLA